MFWLWLFSLAIIVLGAAVWKLHPLSVLLLTAFVFGVGSGMPVDKMIGTISAGFGNTAKSIGLIIIIGSDFCAFMERRGAMILGRLRMLEMKSEIFVR